MFGTPRAKKFGFLLLGLCSFAWTVDFNVSTQLGQQVVNIPMNMGAPDPVMVQQQVWEHHILAQAYEEYIWANHLYVRGMVTGAVQDDANQTKAERPQVWANELLWGYHSPTLFYAEMGKMHLRQGTGFFKRPLDWFYQGWQAAQSQSRTFNEQLAQGVRAVRLGYMFGAQSWQAAVVLPDADSLYTTTGLKKWTRVAGSYKWQVGAWDWTLAGVFSQAKEQRQAGGSFNYGFSPLLSGHGEWVISQVKWREFAETEKIPWSQELLLGLVWAPLEGTSLTLEYSYDQAGLSKKAWRNMAQQDLVQASNGMAVPLLEMMGGYPEFGLVRHYIMGRFWQQFGEPQFDFELLGAINLFDRSTMLGLGFAKVIDNFRINLGLRNFMGTANSEFGVIPVRYTVSTEFEVMF